MAKQQLRTYLEADGEKIKIGGTQIKTRGKAQNRLKQLILKTDQLFLFVVFCWIR